MIEIEERRRKQAIRTIITEIFMFIVIVVLVIALALVAMGYRLNFEKGVEHSGLVQINSIPTGASITVDGEGVFLPTNQSRTMVAGPHEITLTREGYTSWSKTINVTEGMIYRLSYPRLYKTEREASAIPLTPSDSSTPLSPSQVFISPDHKIMLLGIADSSTWYYLNLNDHEPGLRAVSLAGFPTANLQISTWYDSNNRILFHAETENGREWILLNLSRPADSINLSKEFGLDFSDIRLESGDKLLALSAGNLREINLSSKEISKVLLSGVENFVNLGPNLAYVGSTSTKSESSTEQDPGSQSTTPGSNPESTTPSQDAPGSASGSTTSSPSASNQTTSNHSSDSPDLASTAQDSTSTASDSATPTPQHGIFTFSLGGDAPVLAQPLADDTTALLALSEYYGDHYLAYVSGGQFRVYAGAFPRPDEDFSAKMSLKAESQLDFSPLSLTRRGDSELIIASNADQLAVFDAESYRISSFQTDSTPRWLSEFDFYTVQDGQLTAYDFDHTNPRALVPNVSASLPAVISENDHYLYYFHEDGSLLREPIR